MAKPDFAYPDDPGLDKGGYAIYVEDMARSPDASRLPADTKSPDLSLAKTLAEVIGANTEAAADTACIVSVDGTFLTWRQLQSQLERTRDDLRRYGVEPDDRVAVVLPNGPTLATAFLAVSACAACAPLNPLYSAEEFSFYLADLKAKVLIVSDAADAAIEASRRLSIPVLRLVSETGHAGLFELQGDVPAQPASNGETTANSVALLLHTSGTTSQPKLVPLRHRNLIASARNMVATLQLSDVDRCLNIMPLFHIHGLVGGLLAPLAGRGSAVCPPNFRPGEFFSWLEITRANWYTAVPTMHRAVVSEGAGKEDIIARCPLRFIRSSSSPLPAKLFDELSRLFDAAVIEAYSMTEAAHQITCNPLGAHAQKPGTVGVPAGPDVAVMDDAGRLLSAGQTGEVVIRGASVMGGYEANAAANAEAFVNGWFRTGDEGRFDTDGHLVLTGRLKEQINRGGEKISPLEIDQALLRHPEVSEAVAFGFPHSTLGEEVAAAVVLRPQSVADAGQLQAHLRAHIAPFKIPRRILILDQIPKGPTGKVQRRLLSKIPGLDSVKRQASGEPDEPAHGLELELRQIWRRILNNESIGLDDDFFEMGGDSLMALQMLLELEGLTARTVPETILFERPTIRRLAEGLSEPNSTQAEPIIEVQGGDRPPFFFFHGDYIGYGYYTRRLARLLGPEQPFYSIAPHGVVTGPIPSSIDQMAAERLPLILAARPKGPFRLGGYCNGGMMALQVANLLVELGHVVDFVALIDTPILNVRPSVRLVHDRVEKILGYDGPDWEKSHPRVSAALDMVWRQASNLEQSSVSVYLGDMFGVLRRQLLRRFQPSSLTGDGRAAVGTARLRDELVERDRRLTAVHNHAFRRYFPRKVTIPITYFSAGYTGGRPQDLGSRVEVVSLPGGHWGCVTTHAEVLAGHLRQRLEHEMQI